MSYQNQDPNVTVHELVATLRRSNIPNIIVEGKDDVIIYRRLVDDYFEERVDIHQTGGREKLLHLYEALTEAEEQNDFRHGPVAFIADRDMWFFRGIPSCYKDIIWTEGYSIENDLYSYAQLGSRVRDPEYDQVLTSISAWFASKVEEYLDKNPLPPAKVFSSVRDEEYVAVDLHCDRIVPKGTTSLSCGLSSLDENHHRFKEVKTKYNLQLRGKLLFQVLIRFLNSPKYGFSGAVVNYYALYNDAINVEASDKLFSRLKKEVEEKLATQEKKIASSRSIS